MQLDTYHHHGAISEDQAEWVTVPMLSIAQLVGE